MKQLLASIVLALCGVSAGGVVAENASTRLEAVLGAQPDHMKARYKYRHPKETLAFFDVKPGMKVADFMPGREWYGGILMPYIGQHGSYVGVDLSMASWDDYKRFTDDPDAFMKGQESWVSRFRQQAETWRKPDDAKVNAFRVTSVPEDIAGQLDVVMAFRTLHLPHRVDGQVTRLAEGVFRALKPGGVFGVVQHRAPESASDEWANGYNGYVKQSALVRQIEAAGFVLEATSEVNANSLDQPTEEDQVWRLPPANKSGENDHIGESDRMTLKFRKPA